jgi:hypothetical protein
MIKKVSEEDPLKLLTILKSRFEKNMHRHKGMNWEVIEKRLLSNPEKLWSLQQMEETGGEPDVVNLKLGKEEIVFCDCSKETPKDRRSVCYDHEALESRKEHKPKNSAVNMAAEMGIELLSEEQYLELQKLEIFDSKTSGWLLTPSSIRTLGGAIFGDYRFGRVFIYHNGAESYYSVRGFRGLLKI